MHHQADHWPPNLYRVRLFWLRLLVGHLWYCQRCRKTPQFGDLYHTSSYRSLQPPSRNQRGRILHAFHRQPTEKNNLLLSFFYLVSNIMYYIKMHLRNFMYRHQTLSDIILCDTQKESECGTNVSVNHSQLFIINFSINK